MLHDVGGDPTLELFYAADVVLEAFYFNYFVAGYQVRYTLDIFLDMILIKPP